MLNDSLSILSDSRVSEDREIYLQSTGTATGKARHRTGAGAAGTGVRLEKQETGGDDLITTPI